MTHLRKQLLEELQRRNYSERTARIYVRTAKELAEYFGCSPAKLGPEQIRQYQVHLAQEKLAPKTNSLQPPSPVKSPGATVVSFQLVFRTASRRSLLRVSL